MEAGNYVKASTLYLQAEEVHSKLLKDNSSTKIVVRFTVFT